MSDEPVVVAVSPQLLSDAIRRTLQHQGISTTEAQPGGHARIAVVTEDRSAEVDADTVITLVSEGGPADGAGRVHDLLGLRAALALLLPREPACQLREGAQPGSDRSAASARSVHRRPDGPPPPAHRPCPP